MTGPAESKIEIPAKVYIHKRDPLTRSKIPHIDIESPVLNEIIKPDETTFASGKEGGVFIGLKREMLERLEKVLSKLERQI
ncbi:MAG: hypothetical protein QXG10_04605 [Candidatus Hadarchaeales archaeon]